MFPLENPKPDVSSLLKLMKGEKSKRLHFVELYIDDGVLEIFTNAYLNRTWVPYQTKDLEKRAQYWDNVIECYYRLGYDGFRVSNALRFSRHALSVEDEQRTWSDHEGIIHDEESFQNYKFPTVEDIDLWDYHYVSKNIKPGMGIYACVTGGLFEMLTEYLIGFTQMSYLLYDNPELLKRITEKTGEIILKAYQEIVKIPNVVSVFQGDDMGYNTGLMFNKAYFVENILPWHHELAKICHESNKQYWLHSCGNLRALGDEILEFADAKHSFEENGWSVIDYKKAYGDKIGVIGGVDVDRLCRLDEASLRAYCTSILDECTKNERYAYGSGNSIADYIPIKNYLIMLEVGMNYKYPNTCTESEGKLHD